MIHTFEIMHQIMSDGLYDFLMSFKGYGKMDLVMERIIISLDPSPKTTLIRIVWKKVEVCIISMM